ncbi:CaiB/BaiF CoA transferase family protein [Fodinicola acaciae]|uniref:CaiB/BaiF CoA transferase family protein n=1 Tax=Fodinicola acaciae TaxID=2681555 RepID=UPI0013D446D9|nr:CoA transferase [Fodinicola acaciae]
MTKTGALAGVVVADFSRILAGPLAAAALGDLGATVVKVERPESGDDTRQWGPPYASDGTATYYLSANRNKRSVTLDLADPAGLAKAVRLATRADVLIENFRPGVADRLGLGYERLRQANPRLVYASVTGFGSRGEGARLGGYDFLVQAVGGLMSITGWPDGEPTKVGVAVVDVLASLNLQVGILAALQARERSGRGQHVEVSLLNAVLAALVNQASGYLNAGKVPGRLGNEHPSIVPYQTLRAADRPLAVAVGNDAQFSKLCHTIGAPELARDPRYAANASREANRADLVVALEKALAAKPATEWTAVLQAAGLPAGVVNDLAEAFAYAENLGCEPVVELPRGVRQPASPIRLSASPVSYELPPPRLGEHSDWFDAWLEEK